jgi:hypothetical protein
MILSRLVGNVINFFKAMNGPNILEYLSIASLSSPDSILTHKNYFSGFRMMLSRHADNVLNFFKAMNRPACHSVCP